MKRSLCVVLMAGLLVAADDDAIKKELEKFTGTWIIVSAEGGAGASDELKDALFIIADEKFTLKAKELELKGTIKADPTKKPKTVDMTLTDGPVQGKFLGIYELEKDELKCCFGDVNSEDRPKNFEKAEGHILLKLKREKK